MIEPIMYFGIGFLLAALLGLLFVSLVHNRAVRLTMRRVEAATPISVAEIRADKDQLRAEFAMSTRRLEMSVEQMKAKTTHQLAELGKKTEAINHLKKELGEKTTTVSETETREKTLRDNYAPPRKSSKASRALCGKRSVPQLTRRRSLSGSAPSSASVRSRPTASASNCRAPNPDRSDEGECRRLRARRAGDRRTTRARTRRSRSGDQGVGRGAQQMAGLAARTDDVERQLLAQTTETQNWAAASRNSKAGWPIRPVPLPSAKPKPSAHAANLKPPTNSKTICASS